GAEIGSTASSRVQDDHSGRTVLRRGRSLPDRPGWRSRRIPSRSTESREGAARTRMIQLARARDRSAAREASRSRGRGPEVLQEGRGRHEEEVPGDRTAEVEQPVVIARWIADEHVLQHFFDRAGRAAVADEIGPELPLGYLAERHVVSEDLDLLAILRDLGECIVRKGRLDGGV